MYIYVRTNYQSLAQLSIMFRDRVFWSVVAAFTCLWSWTGAVPQLLVVPENQLVPFNLEDNVTFQCEVEGGRVVWEVNNIQLLTKELLMQEEENGIFVVDMNNAKNISELRVMVGEMSSQNNNTVVECIGLDEDTLGTNLSDPVTLITFAAPETPRNLQVTIMRENFLFLSWDPPSNLPPGVETTYNVTVVNPDNGAVYPGFPMNNVANTFVEFAEDLDMTCQLNEFMVIAENDAGSSGPAVLNETIPISPDVRDISDSLMATVSFSGDDVLITLIFDPATACSTTFGVETYNFSLNGVNVMEIPDPGNDQPVTATLSSAQISALLPNTMYSIIVTACSSLTCRQAEPTTAVTTDVQSASVTFVETRVLLSCELAEGSPALGCVFIFTLNNVTERFNVSQSDTVGSQQKRQMDTTQAAVCQTTLNLPDAYDSVTVVDWESDGSEGTLSMTVVPQEDPDPDNFVCPPPPIPISDDGLSDGEIAAIVIVVFLFVVGVFIVLAILTYIYLRRRQVETDKDGWIHNIHIPLLGGTKTENFIMRVLLCECMESSGREPVQSGDHDDDSDDEAEMKLTSPLTSARSDPPVTAAAVGDGASSPIHETPMDDVPLHSVGPPPISLTGATVSLDPLQTIVPQTIAQQPERGMSSTDKAPSLAGGTIRKPRCVAQLDMSNPKRLRLKLDPKQLSKLMKRQQREGKDNTELISLFPE